MLGYKGWAGKRWELTRGAGAVGGLQGWSHGHKALPCPVLTG